MEKDSQSTHKGTKLKQNSPQRRLNVRIGVSNVLSFVILFALWIVLSGQFNLFHLTLGLLSCCIVAAFSGRLMFASDKLEGVVFLWLRLALYIPWLIYQIFLANLNVLYLAFHPRMKDLINPQIIEFESRLKGDYSRTTLANSITLTPGTITVNVTVLGMFTVHCINDRAAQMLPGEMEKRVINVFRE